MKKLFNRIGELKEEMRTMLDGAESEKRSLTEAENAKFLALKNEKELLQMKIEKRNLENETVVHSAVSGRALFAKVIDDVVNHRSLADYAGVVTDGGIKVIERAGSVTDATTAADMVPVSIGEVIEPLEKGLIINKLGIKMQSGLIGELTFPTLQAIEASIAGETAAIGDTKLNIGKIISNPKRVSISVPVSRRAINQTNYALQDIVLKQISLGVARLLNKWMFSDTILAGASAGVFVKNKPSFEYETALTFANVVELETAVMGEGVDVTDDTSAYVCTPQVYGALKSTPKEKGSAEMICTNNMINGYPVLVTSYMAADSIGFGVFSYSAIGQFGDIDLIVDPYSAAKTNIVNFVLNSDYDIVVARKEAFAIAKKKEAA